MRTVSKPRTLHVIERDLDHEAELDRLPRQILAAVPPTRTAGQTLRRLDRLEVCPVLPRMIVARAFAQRLELIGELGALGLLERCADADVMKRAGLVVETEQQRADEAIFAALVPTETGDDAV